MPPERQRREQTTAATTPNGLAILLPVQQPFDWGALLGFLAPRAIPGVESVSSTVYARNFTHGDEVGRLEARLASDKDALELTVSIPDSKALPEIASRCHRLFDLDADPEKIARHLGRDRWLADLVRTSPGLRVPGAWDGFELAVRAILGQQVTVKGATTLCGRLVEAYGERIDGGFLFPRPRRLRQARFSSVGLPKARAAALRRLAAACDGGDLKLQPGADPERVRTGLVALPGIGGWTAQYIAMRALGESDAFPATDLALLKAAAARSRGQVRTASQLRKRAQRWRPWRAYAAMHLWRGLASPVPAGRAS